MPRALKEKAELFNDIETFLLRQGGSGAKVHEIAEHLSAEGWANLAAYQVNHALGTMQKLGTVTKWKGNGYGNSWVAVRAQEKSNKEINEPQLEPTADLMKALLTGEIRLHITIGFTRRDK